MTSKRFSKFFDISNLDGRCTKHSSNAAAAAFILLLSFFLSEKKSPSISSIKRFLSHEIDDHEPLKLASSLLEV